ncbi:MAG: T9SS type A sorting domain-containing protein [Ignavibacteriaceae bacterium]|nr:T9SS type A sorting domain-containing protein [Ignavibacteriaceae bacterium]
MVTLKVYDVLGKEVKTLVYGFKEKGRYEVTFDASKLASGLYIYEIKSGSFKPSKKMTFIK